MNKTIVEINDPSEMVRFVRDNGTQCRFVSMVSETPVTNVRVGCPHRGDLTKISRKQGMINMSYNKAVCKRIAAKLEVEINDVEYTNGEVWYRHLTTIEGKALPIVVNKKKYNGEHYLQFFTTKSENVYKVTSTGEIIPEDRLKPFFYGSDRPDWKPVVISVNVSNIKKLCASGVVLQVEDVAIAEAELENALR